MAAGSVLNWYSISHRKPTPLFQYGRIRFFSQIASQIAKILKFKNNGELVFNVSKKLNLRYFS